ncbi:MAG: VWA domain-containing protein, partial [Acidobacteria bacterium]|nr:VWA domain-containing protein [Acidobacteriota bacterium]
MKKVLAGCLATLLALAAGAQTPPVGGTQQQQQTQPPAAGDEEVLRITTQLVQVDAVVTDKNDRVIPDLKLSDFEVTENGKKQDVQFVEFVSGDAAPRADARIDVAGGSVEPGAARNLAARDLRRVFAFVVDDLTIPFDDIVSVRTTLRNFVDNRMGEGDLVAIVRVIGGRGILQQFTSDKQLLRRAIDEITPRLSPYSAFNNLATPARPDTKPAGAVDSGETGAVSLPAPGHGMDFDASPDGTNQGLRPLISLSVAGDVINSMR